MQLIMQHRLQLAFEFRNILNIFVPPKVFFSLRVDFRGLFGTSVLS